MLIVDVIVIVIVVVAVAVAVAAAVAVAVAVAAMWRAGAMHNLRDFRQRALRSLGPRGQLGGLFVVRVLVGPSARMLSVLVGVRVNFSDVTKYFPLPRVLGHLGLRFFGVD